MIQEVSYANRSLCLYRLILCAGSIAAIYFDFYFQPPRDMTNNGAILPQSKTLSKLDETSKTGRSIDRDITHMGQTNRDKITKYEPKISTKGPILACAASGYSDGAHCCHRPNNPNSSKQPPDRPFFPFFLFPNSIGSFSGSMRPFSIPWSP